MTTSSPKHSSTVAGIGACYALGTFTDNFYKQAAVLLAASLHLTWIQSVATVLFALPFILFSAGAGWLADRLVKKHIVVAAKLVELVAMLAGAVFLMTGEWRGILAVIFCMGLQATVFSPALNGSIPEVFPAARVPRVNSLIKLASTAAVLAGIAGAGVFLDLRTGLLGLVGVAEGEGYGPAATGAFAVLVAALGVVTALFLQRRPAALAGTQPGRPFPWSGPLDSWRHFLECRKDEQLFLVLLAEGYFYGVAAMAVVSVANLATDLGYSATMASLLSASLMVGIAVGALLAGRGTAESWKRLLLPASGAMGMGLILVAFAPFLPRETGIGLNLQLCWLWGILFFCGVAGGIYLIPLASFLQVRPAPGETGKVLGVSNFLSFVSIALWGVAFAVIGLLPPALTFACYGIATLCFAVFVTGARLRRITDLNMHDAGVNLVGLLLRGILSLRYRVTERGLDTLPAALCHDSSRRPILFLPNHPALVDPLIVYSRVAGLSPRPLADENQMRGPLRRLAARLVKAVTIPDLGKTGREGSARTRLALETLIDTLRKGNSVLLYPSGQLYRSAREELRGNSAVSQILEAVPETRVVLVRTSGLWGSSFSYAAGYIPRFARELVRGLLTLLANGIVFMPRRKVTVEFTEPEDLPRGKDKMLLNQYLETFYNQTEQPALAIPRHFLRGSAPRELPPPAAARAHGACDAVPESLRKTIYSLLRDTAGLSGDHPMTPDLRLGADLGIDSLSLMEIAAGIEAETGYPVPNLEPLVTVGDCLLAATGALFPSGQNARPAPPAWFAPDTRPDRQEPLRLPEHAVTLVEAFLAQARSAPALPLLADRSGMRTHFQTLAAALVLARRFTRLPGKRLGIMLPSIPAAPVAWLAAQLAGKEPVMLNWTAGAVNLRHCFALAEVSHVITASPLRERLAHQGLAWEELPVTWTCLDELVREIPVTEKLCGAIRARLHCLGLWPLSTDRVPDTAGMLFTSGSESAPKGVPLSHRNVMANARDIINALGLLRRERILAMLPPFHSFGFMAGVALPLSAGLAAAYHPNPTEGAPLNLLVRDYALTLLGATPTFLEGMLARATGTEYLDSLRFAFIGAEKCPERLFQAFAERCPRAALCEGYGITECSPAVAVNRPDDILPGSMGLPLPSVHIAVVREESLGAPEEPVTVMRRAPAGETGMLLVRGPSIFSGYAGGNPNPFVLFEGASWYRTGDLVRQDDAGRLFFMGRLKRFVKIGGEMISLPQMESLLLEALRNRDDIPGDGAPWLAVEAKPGSEDAGRPDILAFTRLALDTGELNRLLKAAGLSPLHTITRVVRVDAIPVLGTGKTDYRALVREFA